MPVLLTLGTEHGLLRVIVEAASILAIRTAAVAIMGTARLPTGEILLFKLPGEDTPTSLSRQPRWSIATGFEPRTYRGRATSGLGRHWGQVQARGGEDRRCSRHASTNQLMY